MSWDSRARRVVTIYLPLACFVVILLFLPRGLISLLVRYVPGMAERYYRE